MFDIKFEDPDEVITYDITVFMCDMRRMGNTSMLIRILGDSQLVQLE